MTVAIAIKVSGELENLSTICLPDSYPMGQTMRGAFGYIFMDMGLNIMETYTNGKPILYFKDCFVKHQKDGGRLVPTSAITYRCDKCNELVASPVVKDSVIGIHIGQDRTGNDKVNSFYNDAITNKNTFGFEVVLNMKQLGDGIGKEEERLSDLLAAVKEVEANGINIGKRNDKGFGKMRLKNLDIKEISMRDIQIRSDDIASSVKSNKGNMTIHLISDCVSKGSLCGTDILREVKNASKFFTKWNMGSKYEEPEINIVRHENDSRRFVEFLDLKIVAREGVPKKVKEDVISRGAKYYCLLDGGRDLDNIYGNDKYKKFFDSLAIAELLRGIGERTPFGKGQFKVM